MSSKLHRNARFLAGAAIAALSLGWSAPALAQQDHGQHQHHPAPPPPPPPPTPTEPPAPQPLPAPAPQQEHRDHQPAPPPPPQDPHAGHRQGSAQADAAQAEDHGVHAEADDHQMKGALGPYPMTRETGGTDWQPDASRHMGLHTNAGDWMLMGHLHLNAVYDWQEGPRGDEEAFVSGMAMGMARRTFGNGHTLQLRGMLSPDPLMGRSGYPLLLASGETANGLTPLIDRQHPHDFFMELSASYSIPLGERSSVFLYGGLPGAPAFGPPAFMHRMSAMDSPEAPITHHWLDSTHIAFGVLTAGLVLGDFKIEASRFNGREPDQHRFNIETGPLDSTALRLSWNPTDELTLQGSWTRLISPEQLEPGEKETRWSASAIYTRRLGDDGWWSTTLAWGRRSGEHEQLDAFALESAAGLGAWTLFGRAERTQNDELVSEHGHHGPAYDVGKVSLGGIRDFRISEHVKVGIGGLYALNFVPNELEALYDGDPNGAITFVRLKVE